MYSSFWINMLWTGMLPAELMLIAVALLPKYIGERAFKGICGIILYSVVIAIYLGLTGVFIQCGITYAAPDFIATSIAYSVINYLILFGFLQFYLKPGVAEGLYLSNCIYLIQHFTHSFYLVISQNETICEYSVFIEILLLIICLIICSKYIAPLMDLQQVGVRRTKWELATTTLVLAYAIVISSYSRGWSDDSLRLYTICNIYAMVFCALTLYDVIIRKHKDKLEENLKLQEDIMSKYKEQYEMSQENIALINHKCHDLKHQIAALRHISDDKILEKEIESLEKTVMIYDSIVKTGNETIDTILTEKSLLLENEEIELTIVADGKSADFLSAVDLYTIFGNAIDNAVECVSQFTDKDMRHIGVIVVKRANAILFQFENFYQGQIKVSNNLITSSKDNDGYHGYGLKSIRYIAEKNGGVMTIDTENNIFLLQVLIPISDAE